MLQRNDQNHNINDMDLETITTPTTTTTATLISQLNNEAVESMGRKRVVEAAKFFQKAFDMFRVTSFGDGTEESSSSQQNDSLFENLETQQALPNVFFIEYRLIHVDLIRLSSTTSPHNVFPICPFVFRIPTTSTEGNMDENYISTILIYNLALSHYCVGLIRMQHRHG